MLLNKYWQHYENLHERGFSAICHTNLHVNRYLHMDYGHITLFSDFRNKTRPLGMTNQISSDFYALHYLNFPQL